MKRFVLLIILGSAVSAGASYTAECTLKIKVIRSEQKITNADGLFQKKTDFQILKVKQKDGSSGHCAVWEGRIFKSKAISAESKKEIQRIKAGESVIIFYRAETSEEVKNGKVSEMISMSRWKLKPWSILDIFF